MAQTSTPTRQGTEQDLGCIGSWVEQPVSGQGQGLDSKNSDASGGHDSKGDNSASGTVGMNQNGVNGTGDKGGEGCTPLERYIAQPASEDPWYPQTE
ncbi:hypothetical protein GQ44DRAFT_780565 [Phaeosphaeriaceae sp. PMI808]|nr:hypothetical protein GQ44DRAFT_780565 [Phaeosphaeriaceae sp. PMI808]